LQLSGIKPEKAKVLSLKKIAGFPLKSYHNVKRDPGIREDINEICLVPRLISCMGNGIPYNLR